LLLALLLLAAAIDGAAGDGALVVVTHPGVAASAAQGRNLADVFRRKLLVDARGNRLVPVNLPGRDPLRRAFSSAVLGRQPEDMESYWNERYFHGISPPPVVASVEAVLRFVAATPGAVGYVPACAVDGRVVVAAELEVGNLPAVSCARRSVEP
jgi:hypothetical protein